MPDGVPAREIHPTRLLAKGQREYAFDACKLCSLKRPPKEIPLKLTRGHGRQIAVGLPADRDGGDRGTAYAGGTTATRASKESRCGRNDTARLVREERGLL